MAKMRPLIILTTISCCLLSSLTMGVSAGASPQAAPVVTTADKIVPPLHTTGAGIYDSRNHLVRLVGLNVSGMEWGTGKAISATQINQGASVRAGYVTPLSFQESAHQLYPHDQSKSPTAVYSNIAQWGFNFVRLPISWSDLEPTQPTVKDGRTTHHWNGAYLSALDEIIKQFAARHIMVMLDMHQDSMSPIIGNNSPKGMGDGLPTWLFPARNEPTGGWTAGELAYEFFIEKVGQTGLAEAWSFLAHRYATNKDVVGADLFNEPFQTNPSFKGKPAFSFPDEPEGTPNTYVNDMYSGLANAVRAANPRLLLVFEGLSVLAGQPKNPAGQNYPNSVLSDHFYPPPGSDEVALFASIAARAQAVNAPLWVGEFAVPCSLSGPHSAGCPPSQATTNLGGFSVGDITHSDAAKLKSLLSYFTEHDVSWSYWNYKGVSEYGKGYARPLLLETLRDGI
jgi:Cellulase (glycosyl hydrolase family 5)